jgi:Zn-finger in ubiquitin-hydrolases and other protein
MSDQDLPPPIAAASAPSPSPSISQALYAVETLVQVFGFSPEAANEAVDAVGIDVTQCYNYILDQNLGNDTGGAVYPIENCPHLKEVVTVTDLNMFCSKLFEFPCQYQDQDNRKNGGSALKQELDETASRCPKGENWCCLTCQGVFCSRYVNGHGLDHWKDTKKDQNDKPGTEPTIEKNDQPGHCIAVSLADLSVWCHECRAYLVHDETILKPIVLTLQEAKFQ